MKNLIKLTLLVFLISSCASYEDRHFFQRGDGTWITRKQWERATNRAWKKAMKEIPKEDLELLFDVPVKIDTTSNPK